MRFKLMVLRLFRKRALQFFWGYLQRISVIGQNYWSSMVSESGELVALDIALSQLQDTKELCVLDVGANIGQFAIAFAQKCDAARIYSFEPSKNTFELLVKEISNHNLDKIIQPFNFALGEAESSATLYSSHAGSTLASLYNLQDPPMQFKPEFSESVNVSSIDNFCKEHGIQKIDYLKIDVEGHELAVLRGAKAMLEKKSVQFIQFEFGVANIDSRTYMRDFFDLLANDYFMYRIVSDGLYLIENYHPNIEVFATINYLAVRKNNVA